MATQLKWSSRAHTTMTPSQGSFQDGNARWCGYEDVARHIAGNPNKFTEQDRRKAKNILLSIGAEKLADQIQLDGAL